MTTTDDTWASLLAAAHHPGRPGLTEAVELAVELGCRIDPESLGCSVTMVAQDGYVTPAASSPQALGLDQVQYAHDEGPCVAAARSGAWHDVEVMRTERRWPSFIATAVAHGVASSLSIPVLVPVAGRHPGVSRAGAALNLYSASERAFSDERRRTVADFLARCLSAALSGTVDQTVGPAAPPPGLQESIVLGQLITRAVEILEQERNLTHPAAYRMLADASKFQARPLAAIAADVLAAAGRQ